MSERSYSTIENLNLQMATGEATDADKEMLGKVKNIVFYQHELRAGVFTCIEENKNQWAPYYNQIKELEKASGVDIEYVVLSSWEELRSEVDKHKEDGITKIIMFNNSYDQSLIQEAASGKYADLERDLKELGFYEEEVYEQNVLQAGRLEGQQVLVPVLYNVSGVIHGEIPYMYGGEAALQEKYLQDEDSLDFQAFIEMLNRTMTKTYEEEGILPFMSAGFIEGKEPDLFLCAAGEEWRQYRKQEDLFELMYNYLKTYDETQVQPRKGEISLQSLWAEYINEKQYSSEGMIPVEIVRELQIDLTSAPDINENNVMLRFLGRALMNQTSYFVECSGADDVAYHSVIGLLGYRKYYNMGLQSMDRGMIYCPIGTLKEEERYAAQPISYAAVVDGGNTKLAAKVIEAIANQPCDLKYGFSVNKKVCEEQIGLWSDDIKDKFGQLRGYKKLDNGEYEENGSQEQAYWEGYCGRSDFLEDTKVYAKQLQEQLDHIILAQIPDREILKIWQDTLTESVAAGVPSQEGFEVLCERMDAWWK